MALLSFKGARIESGKTQKVAAKFIGVSNKTLGKWERGEAYPPTNFLPVICECYGVQLSDLNFLPEHSLKACEGGATNEATI